jgi:hypothetical protein
MYKEWVNNSNGFLSSFYPIFVCSDPTVKERDQQTSRVADLGFPVTTNAEEIVNVFSSTQMPKVIFSTYQSSLVIAEVCRLNPSLMFDLAIADEAHHCAGGTKSEFATIVKPNMINTHKKLFMTATPKVFSDHVKQKTQEYDYELVSMDDPEKFGSTFHRLSFSEAIRQNLLTDYRVLISVMNNEMYCEYAQRGRFVSIGDFVTDARTLASQILIAKAIKKLDLRRVISFHSRTKTAKEFINTFSQAESLLVDGDRPSVHFKGTIFGEMPQKERLKVLSRFKDVPNGASSVLANVKCLSEGVDVPSLDGIAFVDPKGSEIDIVQAVGRAIRRCPSGEKKIGTIIIPIFIEESLDEDVALEASCFNPIWKVVRALREHDDILAEELDNLRLELGPRTHRKPLKLSKITVDVPVKISDDFCENILIKIVERCSSSWNYQYEMLKEFKKKHGHCNVPRDYLENRALAVWVCKQRYRYKKGRLLIERVEKLEEIGFDWDPLKAEWENKFVELCVFKKEHGHCDVPKNYEKNHSLETWVTTQRALYKKGKISAERIQKLEEVGFDWDPFNTAWENKFAELCKFKKNYGHCNVPQGYTENLSLGAWVTKQRSQYKKGKLLEEQIQRLEEIAFDWDPLKTEWESKFAELCKFKKNYGHCNIPRGYTENLSLGAWVTTQRALYKKGKISAERIQTLEEIGFDWDPLKTAWENKFAELREFKKEHGHCNVPDNYRKNSLLGKWVGNQRVAYNKDKLSAEQIRRLEEIGFDWAPLETAWEDQFAALCAFKAEHGHCNAPRNYAKNRLLGKWVGKQRSAYKKGKLPVERVEKLEEIGFDWDPFNTVWENKFAELCEFKKEYGHCNVPQKHPMLGWWVARQRSLCKKGMLLAERVKRLEEMGFVWQIKK